MTRLPPRSNRNTSLFIGLWVGLTLAAGVIVFVLLFWALGGFEQPAPTAVPVAVSTTVAPTAPPLPVETPGGSGGQAQTPACAYPPPPASGFAYGIQSHVFGGGDNGATMNIIRNQLGLYWVKIQVRWDEIERQPGQMDWGLFDYAMREACAKGVRVMLSVVAAPDWTHANPMPAPEGQQAPPDDFGLYASFVGQIVDRYKGQVGAVEVWNEANLEREWNTPGGINAAEYVRLLQVTYTAIKSREPDIIVIAGAPAPTGVNLASPEGRPLVVDDATFVTQLVQAGGLAFMDCMGTHSNGTNLPPEADGANPPDGAGYTFRGAWDNPHYSWALRSQVETYAQILNGQKPQCVTEFGYASAVDGKYPPNFGFAADVSESQQAEYLVRAFNWMRGSGHVRMALLFNLDYGPLGRDPAEDDNAIFSILYPNGAPRPAFGAIQSMPKP
jgi:hypothetical protein